MKFIRELMLRLANMNNQRLLILAVGLTGGYYFLFYDGGADLSAKLAAVTTKLSVEQGKAQESERALKQVDLIRSAIGSLNEQFKHVSQQLPSEVENSEILKSVNTLARSAGVSIKSAEPKPSIRRDILELIPLHVKGQGSFSEITMFIYYIASMERISKVVNFTISQVSGTDARSRARNLSFEGDVLSFRFAGDEKAPEGKK